MNTSLIDFINPKGLFVSNIYSQAALVPGSARTLYIGGQNAVDEKGQLVGGNSLAMQTRQVLKNILTILQSGGADFSNVVKMNIYLVNGTAPREGAAAFQEMFAGKEYRPLVTGIMVAGLTNPAYLVEIDGIAVIPG